ncbi:MAG: STAS domain-containing protein [Acidimicrobiales bacterium]
MTGWEENGATVDDGAANSRAPSVAGGSETESWLRVELQSSGRTCTLALVGALGGTSIAALQAQVDQLGCIPCDEVIVDVGGLTSIDRVGGNVLLGLYHYVEGRGGHLRFDGAADAITATLHRYALEYAADADEAEAGDIDAALRPVVDAVSEGQSRDDRAGLL